MTFEFRKYGKNFKIVVLNCYRNINLIFVATFICRLIINIYIYIYISILLPLIYLFIVRFILVFGELVVNCDAFRYLKYNLDIYVYYNNLLEKVLK